MLSDLKMEKELILESSLEESTSERMNIEGAALDSPNSNYRVFFFHWASPKKKTKSKIMLEYPD